MKEHFIRVFETLKIYFNETLNKMLEKHQLFVRAKSKMSKKCSNYFNNNFKGLAHQLVGSFVIHRLRFIPHLITVVAKQKTVLVERFVAFIPTSKALV